MIKFDLGAYSIDNKLCKQCGACVGICTKGAIEYTLNSTTGLMNLSINQDKCIRCGLCMKHCPSTKNFIISDVYQYAKERKYYLGHNSNEDVRRKASSGGVARSIIIEGLKNGIFDAVYTLRKTDFYPFVEGYVYTKENIPDYDDIPNSVYHSAPAAMNLKQIPQCKNLLIVGTTCQLFTLKKFADKRCENLFSLCIFCKQQKTFESSKFIAKIAGVKLNTVNDVKEYAYRGNGWPGYCMFNGKTVPWGAAALMPFGKKLWTVPGCDVCGNPFGESVDLTVLDPWIINKQNETGSNIIVVHNDSGQKVLDSILKIEKKRLDFDYVEPALMLNDIRKKNTYIPYFRGCENDPLIKSKGDAFVNQRSKLSSFLNKAPRLPLITYSLLVRLIKDKR